MNNNVTPGLIAFGVLVAGCGDDDAGGTDPPAETTNVDEVTTSTPTAASTSAAPTTVSPTTPAATSPASGPADGPVAPEFEGFFPTPLSPSDNDRFVSIAEGADGSLYAAGLTSTGEDHAFAVAKFTDRGAPDPTFGTGGVAVVNVTEGGGGAEVARGLVVEPDGKVVVTGPFETAPVVEGQPADNDVAVIRLDASGVPDATFGVGGIAKIDLGAGRAIDEETYLADNAWGLTARTGGYAVFGVTPNADPNRRDVDYAIVGVTSDGRLDETFGTQGVVTADVNQSADSARNIISTPDGTLLATGYSRDADDVVSPVLIRANGNGVLDETWGDNGVVNDVVLDAVTESYQVALKDDDYVLAGYGRGADDETVDLVVYRFLADGSLDTTFGDEGTTRVDLAGEDDRARNLTILPDGRILVVGSGKMDAENVDAMAVLLEEDGALVTEFGENGHHLVDLGGPADAFFGLSVSADGSGALLAGHKGADPDGTDNDDAVLARIAL